MLGAAQDRKPLSYPYDAADFGRCFRLLEVIPEWRARLSEMAAHGEQWAALVATWPTLEGHFRTRAHEVLSRAMRAIIDPIDARDPSVIRVAGFTIHIGRTGR